MTPPLRTSAVTVIQYREAKHFIERFEHLGNVGLGVWHWGLWLGGELASVVSYGTPSFARRRGWLSKLALTYRVGLVQLCRGASAPWAPTNTASKLIAASRAHMRQAKGPVIVVAYADESCGEIGTIYQACGAVYTGMTDPKGQAEYIICGRRMSAWAVRRHFGTRDRRFLREVDPSVRVVPLNPKHRYVMIGAPRLLSRSLRAALSHFERPYPKRL